MRQVEGRPAGPARQCADQTTRTPLRHRSRRGGSRWLALSRGARHVAYLHLARRAQQPITVRWRVRQIGERRLLGDKPGTLFSAEGWPVIHAAQEVEARQLSGAALSCLAIGEAHPVRVRDDRHGSNLGRTMCPLLPIGRSCTSRARWDSHPGYLAASQRQVAIPADLRSGSLTRTG